MGSERLQERYVNPYTDFGFKKLFGTELNKELLISFLNALLQGEQTVKDVTYLNTEHLGTQEIDRRAVFDVYCKGENGEKFLVEMPKFNKEEHELETMFDKWMFVLRNLGNLMERPVALQEKVFNRLFEAAEIARFNRKKLVEYEDSLKAFRDWYSVMKTTLNKGREEGRVEGRAEEKIAIDRQMKANSLSTEVITKCTGLSQEEINGLQ